LVYVSAIAAVKDMPATAYNFLPEMADSLLVRNFVADPAVIGAIRCDFDGADGRELARRTFYHDVPRPLAERALSMVASDAPAGVDGVVAATRERFGSIPRTWVLCTEDRVLRPALPGLLASAIADAAITLSR
jgi:hypothetical protein